MQPDISLRLLERLDALKRLPAFDGGSIASRLFVDVAALLVESTADETEVLLDWLIVAGASGAVLGGCPPGFLDVIGPDRWREMCQRACAHTLADAPAALRDRINHHFDALWSRYFRRRTSAAAPARHWLGVLAALPRGGYSSVASGKCIPVPRETQGEHCLVTAIYAALIARARGVPAAGPCLMAMFHHLPAVMLPVIDHEGDAVLGRERVVAMEQEVLCAVLADFPQPFCDQLLAVFARYNVETDPGDPFLIADVVDRAIGVRRHAAVAALTLETAVRDYELLNGGMRGEGQRAVLASYGLLESIEGTA